MMPFGSCWRTTLLSRRSERIAPQPSPWPPPIILMPISRLSAEARNTGDEVGHSRRPPLVRSGISTSAQCLLSQRYAWRVRSPPSSEVAVPERDEQLTLPLLTLTSGVVLPGMIFTLALETEEAKVAVEAARAIGGQLLVVPNIEGRYARVGVIAEIVEEGELPGGLVAVIVRGDRRAEIGTGVPGTGRATWVQVEPLFEPEPSRRAGELAREYRAVLENILLTRGARRMAERLRSVHEPTEIADLAGYSPDLSLEEKVQVLETIDLEARLRFVLARARETLADLALRDQIKSSVEEGMEKTQREFLLRRQLEAIRKELGELTGSAAAKGE